MKNSKWAHGAVDSMMYTVGAWLGKWGKEVGTDKIFTKIANIKISGI